MSQGKVLVEFKKANGGDIEVSEEKFLQSQQWFERIKFEPDPPQPVDGEVDNFNDEDHSYDEDEKNRETPEREGSPELFSEYTESYPEEPPKTPAIIIKNTAKFKPFTPPTISDKLRQEMIAKRNSDRKRKAEDELPILNIPTPPSVSSTPSTITPEQRERARKSREAALAIRRSLQNQ